MKREIDLGRLEIADLVQKKLHIEKRVFEEAPEYSSVSAGYKKFGLQHTYNNGVI